MTLRTKFSLSASILIVGIILGISVNIFIAQKKFLADQLEESRSRIFRDFIYTCSEALVVKDEIQVFNTTKSIIKTHNPAIVYAGYLSATDTAFFSTRDQEQMEGLKMRMVRAEMAGTDDYTASTGEMIREFGMPFYIKERYAGTIRAGFSQSYFDEQVKEGLSAITRKIQGVAIIALLIGILAANALAFYLNKPIRELASAADDIGQGNLNRKVEIDRDDELGKLGRAFNEMVRKLRELDELKDGFVSSVSHELRSPLAAIDGYCDYLIEGLERNLAREKQEKSLRIMKDATVRLTNFINNILDIAKIKAGRFELRRMPVNITELSQEIVALFASLAAQQKKTVTMDMTDALPNLDADPEKIKQVITNLIGNSLKFTPENASITISAHLASNPHFVEVWVTDTGVGIPADAVDKVFEKFYQVKESEMKKPPGTGLGLAIVSEIVRLHDGKIWVESKLGVGSVFKFTLPVWKNT
ncbi:MAG: HAMP domain-containing sensor histidine kinase [Elusimicrobia bacterium]|nr:HAMP domain-containing sensor histidine kinase [Elusimicrobiota bacterium]